jgi:hypothetical protein
MDHVGLPANDYISNLSPELLQQIVSLLRSYDLPAVARTNRRLKVDFTCSPPSNPS